MRPRTVAPGRGWTAVDWLWLLFWAAASSAWCVSAAGELSATFDEPMYVARGLEAWRTGSHAGLLRLGTMPLPADVQTLPLYLYESGRGVRFDTAADLDRILPWARAATLAFWWLLLTYGCLTGRALAGAWGGRLAVAWLGSEPSLLAHAGLATPDIAAAACVLALAYHFRAGRAAGWPRRVGVPALWFAAALVAKGSALLLGPVCLLVLSAASGGAGGPPAGDAERSAPHRLRAAIDRLRESWRDFAAILAGGLLLAFLYCGSDWRAEPSFVAWADALPDQAGVRAPALWVAEHLRIFSNAGEGLVRLVRHNLRGHGVFLLGAVDRRALWYYFPVLLTIKLSEPLLLAPLLVAAVRPRALANWPLMIAAVLVVCSATFRVQLGIRMVLPIVVFAAVGSAAALVDAIRAIRAGWSQRLLAGLAVAFVLWNAAGALAVWPQGLAYVNRFWGGTADGYRLVSDSNYDWGQGLKELLRWQRQQPEAAPLDVWYFGTDPLIRHPALHDLPLHTLPIGAPDQVVAALRGHRLAVSTTLLYGAALDGEAYRQAVAVLRARPPIARTTTFLIYDFTAD